MSKGGLHDPTFSGSTASHAGARGRAVPHLSILWHPDVERIGETVLLADPVTKVSRLAPLFGRSLTGDQQPLTTSHLSRSTSLEIRWGDGDEVVVSPGDVDAVVEVAGERLTGPRTLSWKDADAGVPIALGKRVALCLHLAPFPATRVPPFGMIGDSQKMNLVRATLHRLSDLDTPVLIRGETGSGKEMVARALATNGPRKNGPFVAVNMATVSPTTAESQLFGHERGAFTGADKARPGFFAQADGGTLFLDEVGLTPLDVQAMLLRVLETGEVRPMGGSTPKRVNVRVIAATDLLLEDAIAARTFSEPLFHRLAGFQIAIPPLRERRQDIGPLLLHFLREELGKTGEGDRLDGNLQTGSRPWLSASLVARLATAPWPGNVRSLANVARQIAISSRGQPRGELDEVVVNVVYGAAGLGAAPVQPRPARDDSTASRRAPASTPSSISDDALLAAMKRNNYEPGAAATDLGIARNSLYELIERHPTLRKATDIPAEEVVRLVREEKGDLGRAAERLQISKRALALRVRQMKLDPG